MEGDGPELNLALAQIAEDEIKQFFISFCKWHFICHGADVGYETEKEGVVSIDLLFDCFNPFRNQKEVVLIQVKNYTSINPSKLNEHLNSLRESQRNLSLSHDFANSYRIKQLGTYEFNNSIIVYKFKDYSLINRKTLLQQVKLSKRVGSGKPPIIQYLDNLELSRFYYFKKEMSDYDTIEYYYPRYLKNDIVTYHSYLSLDYLRSDFILGRALKSSTEEEIKFILYLNHPSEPMFRFFESIGDRFMFDFDWVILGLGKQDHFQKYKNWAESELSAENIRKIPQICILNNSMELQVDLKRGY